MLDLGEWFSINAADIRKDLVDYFGGEADNRFSGRWFEIFAAMSDPARFAPSDVLAVEALRVKVPPESAARLLVTEADHFNELLARIPADVDLWQVPRSDVESNNWAAARLHTDLKNLDGVGGRRLGYVTAGKLLAAKRPRLIPILDSRVKTVLHPPAGRFWVSMHEQLCDESRRQTIAAVCDCAPDHVSLLRQIDVALWMEGHP